MTELAKELDITPETLRRDLTELEEENELVRIHEKPAPKNEGLELEFRKNVLMSEEKKRVARRAAKEWKGMTIGADVEPIMYIPIC